MTMPDEPIYTQKELIKEYVRGYSDGHKDGYKDGYKDGAAAMFDAMIDLIANTIEPMATQREARAKQIGYVQAIAGQYPNGMPEDRDDLREALGYLADEIAATLGVIVRFGHEYLSAIGIDPKLQYEQPGIVETAIFHEALLDYLDGNPAPLLATLDAHKPTAYLASMLETLRNVGRPKSSIRNLIDADAIALKQQDQKMTYRDIIERLYDNPLYRPVIDTWSNPADALRRRISELIKKRTKVLSDQSAKAEL